MKQIKNLMIPVLGSILLAATINSVTAEDLEENIFELSLEEALDIEVSTASKFGVNRKKSPGNMVVITQEQIRRYGYRNVGEALERVTGFLNTSLGINTFIGYRGLSPQSTTANSRILVLVDGIRYNEWEFDVAALNESFPLDIESIDRIEVLKGAGSAIWGTNALFAVVNVISKTADSERTDQVLYERGANNRNKGYMSWGGETEGGVKIFTSASVTREEDNIAAFYPAFQDPPTENGIAREFYDQDSVRANLKMSYEGAYSNVIFGGNNVGIGSGVDFLFDDGGASNYSTDTVRAEVGYKGPINEQTENEFLARTFYTYDKYKGRFNYPNFDEPGNEFQTGNSQSAQAIGAEVRYSQRLSDSLKALAGVEFARVFHNPFKDFFSEVDSTGEQLYEDNFGEQDLLSTRSYFFDLMYNPIDMVTVFLGGRLDDFSGLDSTFGPRASVVVNPDDMTTLRFIYSRGLRNPSIGERLTPSDTDDSIDSEDLNFYELFAERRFSDWLSVSSALFYSDLSNTIGFAAFEDGNQTYQNNPGFTSRGIELEARAQIDHDLQGYFNVTYALAKDKASGMEMDSFPHTLARTGLSYGENRGLIVVSPELVFGSGTETTGNYEFDSFVVANLTLLSYPMGEGFNLAASLYNVFDEDFVRLAVSEPDNSDTERALEQGREFRVQAKWDF